jgi:hypothetical protein
VLPLYGVTRWNDLRSRIADMWERRRWLGVATLAGAAVVMPQVVLYRIITASWLVSPYGALNASFAFGSPHLFGVLFSTQKGLFFWSPLLLLAVPGAIVASGWARGIVIAAVIVFVIQVYLAASWFDWQFGASYGHRAFADGLGLAALLVAACFEWAARRAPVRRAVAIVAAVLVALSVVQMLQYWTRSIPEASTTWDQYRESFLRFR